MEKTLIEKIQEWKEDLQEYGQLHNDDCCVNFENCDCGTKDDDCCENIRAIADFFREHAKEIVEFISYDMRGMNEEQREETVKLYNELFDLD